LSQSDLFQGRWLLQLQIDIFELHHLTWIIAACTVPQQISAMPLYPAEVVVGMNPSALQGFADSLKDTHDWCSTTTLTLNTLSTPDHGKRISCW
jgi:hypothetical protein